MGAARRDVLLSRMSSRPINAYLCLLFMLVCFAFVYTLQTVVVALASCAVDLEEAGNGRWLKVLSTDFEHFHEVEFGFSMIYMQSIFNAVVSSSSNLTFRTYTDPSLLPWCGWCFPKDAPHLNELLNSATDLSIPNKNVNLTSASWFFDYLYSASRMPLWDAITSTCSYFLFLNIVASLAFQMSKDDQGMQLAFAPLFNASLASSLTPEEETALYPCGSLYHMQLRTSGKSGQGLVDELTGEDLGPGDALRLVPRCVSITMRHFLEFCVLDANTVDFSKNASSRSFWSALVHSPPDASVSLTDNGDRKPEGTFADIGIGDLLEDVPAFADQNNEDWGNVIASLRDTLVTGGPDFIDTFAYCIQFSNPAMLQASFGEPPAKPEDVPDCFAIYTLFFIGEKDCAGAISSGLTNPRNFSAEAYAMADQFTEGLIVPWIVGERSPAANRAPAAYTTYGRGMPTFLLDLVSPTRALNWTKMKPAVKKCMVAMEEAAAELPTLAAVGRQLQACREPLHQLTVGYIVQAALFAISATVFLTLVLYHLVIHCNSYVYGLAMVWLALGTTLSCDLAWYAYNLNSVYNTQVKLLLGMIFNIPEWPAENWYDVLAVNNVPVLFFLAYLSIVDALIYAASYAPASSSSSNNRMENSMTMEPTKPPATSAKGRIFRATYYALALCYFLIRSPLVGFGLNAFPGWVPFVNLITLGRMCTLEDVVPAPVCTSRGSPQEALGSRPFWGNLVASCADLAALLYCRAAGKKSALAISKAGFGTIREVALVHGMTSLVMKSAFAIVFIIGIAYTSMNSLYVGTYSGYADFTQAGLKFTSVSPTYTGVQFWNLGFALVIFLSGIGLNLCLLPADSWLGRKLVGLFPISQLAIEQVVTEREAEKAGLDLWDGRCFCLETQYQAFANVHSTYHIGTSQLSFVDHLPPHVVAVAYVTDVATDTHAIITREGSRLTVSFRGTTTVANVKTDLKVRLVPLSFQPTRKASTSSSFDVFRKRFSSKEEKGKGEVDNGNDDDDDDDNDNNNEDKKDVLGEEKQASNLSNFESEGKQAEIVDQLHRAAIKHLNDANLGSPYVHSGFLRAFHSVRSEILWYVAGEALQGVDQVVIAGHSLGGGIAVIAAAYLGAAFADAPQNAKLMLSTWGCPRVGGKSFRDYLGSVVPSAWRMVQRGDPIVKTPPKVPLGSLHKLGFRHVGTTVLLDFDDVLVDPSLLEQFLLHSLKWGGGMFFHKVSGYGVCVAQKAMTCQIDVVHWPISCQKMTEFSASTFEGKRSDDLRYFFESGLHKEEEEEEEDADLNQQQSLVSV